MYGANGGTSRCDELTVTERSVRRSRCRSKSKERKTMIRDQQVKRADRHQNGWGACHCLAAPTVRESRRRRYSVARCMAAEAKGSS